MTGAVVVLARHDERAVCPACREAVAGVSGVVTCATCGALRHADCPCACEGDPTADLLGEAVALPGGEVGYWIAQDDRRDRGGHRLAQVDTDALRLALRERWGVECHEEDGWSEEALGRDPVRVATEAAAEAAIEDFRVLGDDWAEAEYRVVDRGPELVQDAVVDTASRDGGVPQAWVDACSDYDDLLALERACKLDLIPGNAEKASGCCGDHGVEHGREGGLVLVNDGQTRWVCRAEEFDAAVEAAGFAVAARRLARGVRGDDTAEGGYQDVCDATTALAGDGGSPIDWADLILDASLSAEEQTGALSLALRDDGLRDLGGKQWAALAVALRLGVVDAARSDADHDLKADVVVVARCATWVGGEPGERRAAAALRRLREAE